MKNENIKFATRKTNRVAYRIAIGLTVTTILILIWMNLAVGIIGNEDNPANLLYAGVIIVGLIGAVITRLRSKGMAYTLFAMALAQALVPVIALLIWQPPINFGVVGVFILNSFISFLFIGSALLFRWTSVTNSS